MLIVLHSSTIRFLGGCKKFDFFFPSYLIMVFSKPIQFQFCKCADTEGETVIYWLRLEM